MIKNNLFICNKHIILCSPKHIQNLVPRGTLVYSIRYKGIIPFGEVENSYLNECFEILGYITILGENGLKNIPELFTFTNFFGFNEVMDFLNLIHIEGTIINSLPECNELFNHYLKNKNNTDLYKQ